MIRRTLSVGVLSMLLGAAPAAGQSSSLYATGPSARPEPDQGVSAGYEPQGSAGGPVYTEGREPSRLSPAIAAASLSAVELPEPRRFAVHDLVTIIIRESTETDLESTLETEKSTNHEGEISDFPNLRLRDLLNLQLSPSDMDQGNPRLGVNFNRDFEGEGEYSRRESITTRITARVIDVKPNGSLVLEARKRVQTDDETLHLTITGTARAEDVSIDNTILSTQLYDLRLDQQHGGELRKTTKKGLLTKILEGLFNF